MIRCNSNCGYGKGCYRKNEEHFRKYSHPHLEYLLSTMKGNEIVVPSDYRTNVSESCLLEQLKILKDIKLKSTKKTMGDVIDTQNCAKRQRIDDTVNINSKVEASNPYRFFLSVIEECPSTRKEMYSLAFKDLLDVKLGEIDESLIINYMIDIGWLMAQYYYSGNRGKPITLIYGMKDEEFDTAVAAGKLPHITGKLVKPPQPYSHHHTKMMIHGYTDGSIRVIVYTGNLIEPDWTDRLQGVWVSPVLPAIDPKNKDVKISYESPTNFKKDLLRYLRYYNLPLLQAWIDKIENIDFRKVNVFFIPSVPLNSKIDAGNENWGINYVDEILKTHFELPIDEFEQEHSLIYQCSSIGSLGPRASDWFTGELTRKMTATKNLHWSVQKYNVNLIYPTYENVFRCYGSVLSAIGLPYSAGTHARQRWLNDYLRLWSADATNRTKVVPHIKTYCRVNSHRNSIFWFLLTSANCSKAAWGSTTASGKLNISNYEVGILFLPKFVTGESQIPIVQKSSDTSPVQFPIPYDIPLKKYGPKDTPWMIEGVCEVTG